MNCHNWRSPLGDRTNVCEFQDLKRGNELKCVKEDSEKYLRRDGKDKIRFIAFDHLNGKINEDALKEFASQQLINKKSSKKLRLRFRSSVTRKQESPNLPFKQTSYTKNTKHLQNLINQKQNQPKQVTKQLKKQKSHQIQTQMRNKKTLYFKPSLVNVELKSDMRQKERKHEQNTQQNIGKSTPKCKNYALSKFLNQIADSFLDICPYQNLLEQQVSLQKLSKLPLGYSHLIRILHSLYLVRHSSQQQFNLQSQDQRQQLQKVYLLWKILKSNQLMPNVINLSLLLASIINIDVWPLQYFTQTLLEKTSQTRQRKLAEFADIKQKPDQNQFVQSSHIFFIRNKKLLTSFQHKNFEGIDILMIDSQCRSLLLREFQGFKINRLNFSGLDKNRLKDNQIQVDENVVCKEIQFHSLMSPKSQHLALGKRLKILQQLNQRNSSEQLQKMTIKQPTLNVFLNYKSSRNCHHQDIQQRQPTLQNTQKTQKLKSQINSLQKAGLGCDRIQSEKVKFSQLKSILLKQKGRKLKVEKYKIMEKGWTNSGRKNCPQKKDHLIVRTEKKLTQEKYVSLKSETSCGNLRWQTSCQNIKFQPSSMNLKGDRIGLMRGYFASKNKQGTIEGKQKIQNTAKMRQQKQLAETVQIRQNSNIPLNKQNQQKVQLQKYHIPSEEQRQSDHTLSINNLNDSLNLCQDDMKYCDDNDYVMEGDENVEVGQMDDDMDGEEHYFIRGRQEDNSDEYLMTGEDCITFNTEVNVENQASEPNQQRDTQKKIRNEENIQQGQILQQENLNQPFLSAQPSNSIQSHNQRVIKSYLKIPILYVDVNMDESKKERIIIFQEDNASSLAKQFGRKHKLDIEMIRKLQQMLTEQINGILGRIDEQEEEYDDTKENIFGDKQGQELEQTQQQ